MPSPEYKNLIYLNQKLQIRDIFDNLLESGFSKLVRAETAGTEKNIPVKGSLVIGFLPHSGFLECVLIDRCLIGIRKKPSVWITKEDNRNNNVPKIILSPRLFIFINRESPEKTSFEAAYQVLSTPNGTIGSALEGTRFSNPNDPSDVLTLGESKPGLMRFSYESGAPIMGVVVLGVDKALPALDKIIKDKGKMKALELISKTIINPPEVQIRFLPPYTDHLNKEGKNLRGMEKKKFIESHNYLFTLRLVEEILKLDPDYPLGFYKKFKKENNLKSTLCS